MSTAEPRAVGLGAPTHLLSQTVCFVDDCRGRVANLSYRMLLRDHDAGTNVTKVSLVDSMRKFREIKDVERSDYKCTLK